jgi:hypothetical protein
MNYYHRSLFFRQAEKRVAETAQSQSEMDQSPPYVDTTPQQLTRIR